MLAQAYHRFFLWACACAEMLVERRRWKLELVALTFGLSLFSAFPSYDVIFLENSIQDNWRGLLVQFADPLRPQSYSADSHNSKLAFRLTVPIVAHVLGLGMRGGLVLQIVMLALLFYATVTLAHKILRDRVCAAFVGLAMAVSFPGNVLCSDYRGIFDVVAFSLLLSTMLCKHPLAVFLASLLASFTDERALIASSLVMVYFVVTKADLDSISLNEFVTLDPRTTALALSWIAYFGGRFALSRLCDLKLPPFKLLWAEQINNIFIGLWTGLEGFWILMALAVAILVLKRRWVLLAACTTGLVAVVFTAISVIDITRSMAFLIPGAFLSLEVIRRVESTQFCRQATLAAALISSFPTYYAGGRNEVLMLWPMPLQVGRMMATGKLLR